MQDRPTVDELLEAVAGFLHEDVMVHTDGRLSFYARVAGNVVQMLRRELSTAERHNAAEWERLDRLLGVQPMPSSLAAVGGMIGERNRDLAERIGAGEADCGEWRGEVLAHLRKTIHEKLEVSNPALAAVKYGAA